MYITFHEFITEYLLVFELNSITHEQRHKQYISFRNKSVLYLKKTLNFTSNSAVFPQNRLNSEIFVIISIYFNIHLKVFGFWPCIMSE